MWSRYIKVRNCDMFSVVDVYLDHLKLCVLMVEDMSVVVNVMVSQMCLMRPPPALCNSSARTVVNKYMLTCSMMRIISLLLLSLGPCVVLCLWLCDRLLSVCEVVVLPYVDAVVSVTVMCVLLFVFHVCLLRECDSVKLTAMLVWGIG